VVQFSISGPGGASRECLANRFPFRVGRAPESDLRIEGNGVWDRHATLRLERQEGFILETDTGALLSVNGQRTNRIRLRNGDLVECGSVKMRFWMAPARQYSLGPREFLTWVGLAALLAVQVGLVYHLIG
jgi:hypothetical protein